MLERWGAFVARRALAVLLAGIALTIAAGAYGFGVFDSLSTGGFDDPDSEASVEREAEQDAFGNRSVDIDAIYSARRAHRRLPGVPVRGGGRRRAAPGRTPSPRWCPTTTPRPSRAWSAKTATPCRS